MSHLFTSGDQSTGASASASVLPMNIQDWFPFGLIIFALQGILKSLLQHHNSKASILQHSTFLMVQLTTIYDYWKKKTALTVWAFVSKVMSLLFNMLSKFVTEFLYTSKSLLVLWLQSVSAVILELKKRKSATVSTFPPSICLEAMRLDTMILGFWMLSFKLAFLSSNDIYDEG